MSRSKYTFFDLAVDTVREVGRPLTPEEIWEQATRLGYGERLRTRGGATPWATIAARIYVSMKDDPESPFTKVGKRPVRLFLKDLAETTAPEELEREASRPEETAELKLKERDIHPVVVYVAHAQLDSYCKTIGHERSSKRKKSQWLHPDLVGLYFPVDTWEQDTLDLSREIGATVARIYAFEVKLQVNFGNLRESFFQAVSNSSWANEGYLVAAHFSADNEFQSELKRLSDAFGIGVMRVNLDDPDASEMVYPSRRRTTLDWETLNKLAELNPDFLKFMKAVRDALKIHRINPADFDTLESDPEKLAAALARKRKP